jgi:hypothetical protein
MMFSGLCFLRLLLFNLHLLGNCFLRGVPEDVVVVIGKGASPAQEGERGLIQGIVPEPQRGGKRDKPGVK